MIDKEKLYLQIKEYIELNFKLQNAWGERWGVYFDYDYLKYDKVVAKREGCNNKEISKNQKKVWSTLFDDIKNIIEQSDV